MVDREVCDDRDVGTLDVLCVFTDAPTDDSVASTRWRRLGRHVCALGPALAVVLHDLLPGERERLAELLGARVEALGLPRHTRAGAVARALARPSRSWPLTRTDTARASSSIERFLAGTVPDLVWCAGAECLARPTRRVCAARPSSTSSTSQPQPS